MLTSATSEAVELLVIPAWIAPFSVALSATSPIPAALGHITGRLWRKHKAKRNATPIAAIDAQTRTQPTFVLYIYALPASLTSSALFLTHTVFTLVSFITIISFIEDSQTETSKLVLEAAGSPALSNAFGTTTFMLLTSITAASTFFVAFLCATHRIPKRSKRSAVTTTSAQQNPEPPATRTDAITFLVETPTPQPQQRP